MLSFFGNIALKYLTENNFLDVTSTRKLFFLKKMDCDAGKLSYFLITIIITCHDKVQFRIGDKTELNKWFHKRLLLTFQQ